MMGGGGFFMIFLWLLPVLLIAWAIKWFLDEKEKRQSNSDTPLEILQQRYARGEISNDEFEKIRATLNRG